jgi:hypothetical protein
VATSLEKLHALRQLLLNVPSKETTAQIKALQGEFIEMAPHPNASNEGLRLLDIVLGSQCIGLLPQQAFAITHEFFASWSSKAVLARLMLHLMHSFSPWPARSPLQQWSL